MQLFMRKEIQSPSHGFTTIMQQRIQKTPDSSAAHEVSARTPCSRPGSSLIKVYQVLRDKKTVIKCNAGDHDLQITCSMHQVKICCAEQMPDRINTVHLHVTDVNVSGHFADPVRTS
jgi:hypothetical protein